MGYSQPITLLASSGYAGQGIGLPVLVGSNRALELRLDAPAIEATTTVDVTIETSAYAVREDERYIVTWRKLGQASLVGSGSTALSLNGADAFVRARYAVAGASGDGIAGLALSGAARCVLEASASHSGAGVGSAVDIEQYHGGRFAAVVSAAPGGGETLVLTLERSEDGVTGWTTAATFPAIGAAGEYAVESADLDRFVRIRWAPSGAGSWTFGVSGRTSLIFARQRDRVRAGIRQAAIPNVSAAQYLDFFEAATATMVGSYTAFVHPLRAWGADTRQNCIRLADGLALTSRSKDPVGPEDGGTVYAAAENAALDWLAQVGGYVPGSSGRRIRPADIVDSSPPQQDGRSSNYTFMSDAPRQTGRRLVW